MAQPKGKVLERISPSTAEVIRRCPMELAFSRDPDFVRLAIPSTWALLGTAAHAVLEAIGSGELSGAEAGESFWDAQIERAANELVGLGLLSSTPAPKRWQGYYQARQRALRAVPEDARSGSAGSVRQVVERRIEDEDMRLVGRIDLVEQSANGVKIVDFKSGLRGHDEIKPGHRRQLLIYAYLWHSFSGQWPFAAEIRYLDGKSDGFAVGNVAASEAATAAASMLQEFNRAIEQGGIAARPSSGTCRFCDYRAACDAFMAEVSHGWSGPMTILGAVCGSSGHSNGISLVLELVASSGFSEGPFTVRTLPADFDFSIGDRLAFSHLGYGGPGGSGLVTWETRCFRWD